MSHGPVLCRPGGSCPPPECPSVCSSCCWWPPAGRRPRRTCRRLFPHRRRGGCGLVPLPRERHPRRAVRPGARGRWASPCDGACRLGPLGAGGPRPRAGPGGTWSRSTWARPSPTTAASSPCPPPRRRRGSGWRPPTSPRTCAADRRRPRTRTPARRAPPWSTTSAPRATWPMWRRRSASGPAAARTARSACRASSRCTACTSSGSFPSTAAPTVAALRDQEIDVGVLFSTDPHLAGRTSASWRTTAALQPSENVVPAVRVPVVPRRWGGRVRRPLDAVSAVLHHVEPAGTERRPWLLGGDTPRGCQLAGPAGVGLAVEPDRRGGRAGPASRWGPDQRCPTPSTTRRSCGPG